MKIFLRAMQRSLRAQGKATINKKLQEITDLLENPKSHAINEIYEDN